MAAMKVFWSIACLVIAPALGTTMAAEGLMGKDASSSSCNFSLAMRHPDITGWELELLPPMHMLLLPGDRSRNVALTKVNGILDTTGRKHGLQFEPASLRTSVSSQISRALSTMNGCSLVNSSVCYPWKGPAFLRLRKKMAMFEGLDRASGTLGVPPGRADLTLKIKDVDPRHIPKGLALADTAVEPSAEPTEDRRKPRLKVKVENDIYCSYAKRANYEAKWSPVPPDTDVITLSGVRSFFKNVPHQLGLPGNMTLPLYAEREFSKSVWDMHLAGVRGVVNLVLIFSDQHSSLAGEKPVKAELSFRIKRADIEEVHKPGSKDYYESLDALIDLCNDLHDNGWDEDLGTATARVLSACLKWGRGLSICIRDQQVLTI